MVRFFLFLAAFGLLVLAGCSGGQPAAEVPATGPAPSVAAAPGNPSPAAGTPAAVTAPGSVPAPVVPDKGAGPAKVEEAEPPPRIEVDLDGLIAGLQSPVPAQVFAAGEYFRQIPAAQRREVLLQLSGHTDPGVRGNVWRVFSTVATKEDLATLSEAQQSAYSDVRTAALTAMARFPNDQTIAALTKLLENPDERELAAGLLSNIGPACEGAVLPYASHADAAIRGAAWDVLVHAGTRKSVQTLEQLTTLPQYQKDEPLKRALEELRDRLRKSS